jgi:hypothetical protein
MRLWPQCLALIPLVRSEPFLKHFWHTVMKRLWTLLLLFSWVSNLTALEEYKELPVSGDDLKRALNLHIQKYQLDFDKPGHPSMKIDAASGGRVFNSPNEVSSVTLVVFLERGPESSGANIKGMSTLHFWFTCGGLTQYSYAAFEDAKAEVTLTQMKDGKFSIVARPKDGDEKKPGYAIEIVNFK